MIYEAELKARLDELEALAEHVPPPILAQRVTLATSRYLRSTGHSEVVTERIRNRFGEWYASIVVVPGPVDPVEEEPPPPEEEPVSTAPGFPADPPEEALAQPGPVEEEAPEAEVEPNGKACMKCGEFKDFSEFHKNHMSRDGYRKLSNACAAAPPITALKKSEERIEPSEPAPSPRDAQLEEAKVCKDCGKTKVLARFVKNPKCKGGYSNTCKDCASARKRKRYAERKNGNKTGPEPTAIAQATLAQPTVRERAREEEGGQEEIADNRPEAPESEAPGSPKGVPLAVASPVEKPAFIPTKVTHLPKQEITPPGTPEQPRPEKASFERRRCANGEQCVVYGQLGHPAPLTSGNPGPTCFRCQEEGRNNATMPTSAAIPGTRGRG